MRIDWHKHARRAGMSVGLGVVLLLAAGATVIRVAPGGSLADVEQYALNWAALADLALNTALAGPPDQTVSNRTAIACESGSAAACTFCQALTWGQIIVTLGQITENHCTLTLDARTPTTMRTVWDWNDNHLLAIPLPGAPGVGQ